MVTFDLGRAALVDVATVAIGAIAFVALYRFKVGSHLLVAPAAAAGLALR